MASILSNSRPAERSEHEPCDVVRARSASDRVTPSVRSYAVGFSGSSHRTTARV